MVFSRAVRIRCSSAALSAQGHDRGTGRHRSTNWKVLKRHGCSRRRTGTRPQTTRRYEWSQPGALLHIDAFSVAKFDAPGHWATGERSQTERSRGVGKTVVIGVDLGIADGAATVWGCDLTDGYVRINADYTT